MYKSAKAVLAIIVVFISGSTIVYGQTNISPYTVNGLGDINPLGFTTNFGMGGLGVSSGENWYLNTINPALLTRNNFTAFEAGMVIENRKLSNDNGLKQSNTGGGLAYIALGVPVMAGKWTSSIGIMPYSTVNYDILERSTVEGTTIPATYNYRGDGGLTQAYFSNGFKIAKNLSIGIKASLLFGSIINETLASAGDENFQVNYISSIVDKTSISGFTFASGISYTIKLDDKTVINTGATYDFGRELTAEKFKIGQLLTPTSIDPVSVDTLINNLQRTIKLPSKYAFGISYQKLFKWTIGADVYLNKWSDYKNFEEETESLTDNFRVVIGTEYTPDFFSIDSYFERVTYRFGIDYQKTPFKVLDKQLNDFGMTFGASFPIRNRSTMNLALKYGQRGTKDNNLVQERYFKVLFGITFNDVWFQRRVLN